MTIEAQEETSKLMFRWKAALYAGLGVGLIFFLVSRGIPWFSAEIPDAVMGRSLFGAVPLDQWYILLVLIHFAVSILYACVVAAAVYKLDPMPAVLAGGAIGVVLYALNYLLFRFVFGHPPVSEIIVLVVHVAFCLAVAAMYKALAVEKVRAAGYRAEH
jgi:hypothetical protein